MSQSSKILSWIIGIIVVIIIIGLGWWYFAAQNKPATVTPPVAVVTTTPPSTYGMSEYTDPTYHFSFWYPNGLGVTATATQDATSFPGGVAVETLQIGSMGDTSVVVVNSPTSSITDEPANHASPIAQTEYFYNKTSNQWMVAYPQGPNGAGSGATTVADTSKTTMSGLFMLPAGKRFDTTIIPLSTTQFLVVSDGGGSSFTSQLAQTVSQSGATIDASLQAAALQAEAAAFAGQKSGS